MTKQIPSTDKFRQKLHAFLEDRYVVNIKDGKLEEFASRDMSVRNHNYVVNVLRAAEELTKLLSNPPKSDLLPRERASLRRRSSAGLEMR